MKNDIAKSFGNKVRLRVCGICIENDEILMLKHRNLGKGEYLWLPPGGGVEFGEDCHKALKREFIEETGLKINVGELLFVSEFINEPLHAVELFFQAEITGGILRTGTDPELDKNNQLIMESRFLNGKELATEKTQHLHRVFSLVSNPLEISKLQGYFRFIEATEK